MLEQHPTKPRKPNTIRQQMFTVPARRCSHVIPSATPSDLPCLLEHQVFPQICPQVTARKPPWACQVSTASHECHLVLTRAPAPAAGTVSWPHRLCSLPQNRGRGPSTAPGQPTGGGEEVAEPGCSASGLLVHRSMHQGGCKAAPSLPGAQSQGGSHSARRSSLPHSVA